MPQLDQESSALRHRNNLDSSTGTSKADTPLRSRPKMANPADHPIGKPRHGLPMQIVRIFLFTIYFFSSCLFIHGAQILGAGLYFINKDHFYAWQALCKQYFGLLAITGTQLWSPTVIRITGDESVTGQIKQTRDGLLRLDFPNRLVLIANHQIYTDWLYLWWIAYCNEVPTHGHIFIILKESLKYVPIIGPAMMFYRFIFMARKWAKDQERLRYRLQKLNTATSSPLDSASQATGASQLDPMWLLIFPEGTNLSGNTRKSSVKWATKSGIQDTKHVLLPRSTGLQFCLQELRDTVEYVYDCTIGYEGIPPGDYGQDVFTLRSVYFQGRPPKSVNMHWRRYHISTLPIDDREAMEKWTMERWREKDELMEVFMRTGRFPANEEAVQIEGARGFVDGKKALKNCIETEVRPRHRRESLQIYVPVVAAALVGRILVQVVDLGLKIARKEKRG
ncbi:acyltransferase-domain-containing protein [Polychaeton citri CBS 116435]|uniref:Acyltransferase-domain-containing protein n=1 Tax=Polychaeton citri CBS 116435 TaxID=1314669 RepID=A0A9P4Q9F4_9PEZI|nr:acyltransferase-domain-containing protein [Polychaeton citri CBS 116435]